MERKMSKIATVFKFETIRQLKKPSFWISLLLLPLGLLAIIGLSSLNNGQIGQSIAQGSSLTEKNLGLTDAFGIIPSVGSDSSAYDFSEQFGLKFAKITSEEEGIAKIKSGELDIYYSIPADFLESKSIKIFNRASGAALTSNFGAPLLGILKTTTLAKVDPVDIAIITDAINFNQISFDETGAATNLLGKAIIPIAVLAIFYILICVFGNRLTMALTEEKENRISEMILTAISAKDLVIGKILSLLTLGFVQIAVFIIPLIALLIIYRDNPLVSGTLAIIEFDPITIITNILLLLFSYFFFAGACTLVGSLVPTARDASQYITPVMMFMIAPFFFMNSFLSDTPTLITYIMTYFPFSAPVALMLRNAVGSLPLFELILGVVEIAVCSALVLTLTVKSFQKNAINFSVVRPTLKPRRSWRR